MKWIVTIAAVICLAAVGAAIHGSDSLYTPQAESEQQPAVAIDAPGSMSVEDFLLDVGQLSGQVVSVHGVALCMGADLCFLYAGITNLMQSATFDPKGLSRDVRRRLLDCTAALHYCSIVVTGRVNAQAMMAPLVAQRVYW